VNKILFILTILCSTAFSQCLGDVNEDYEVNILDVVLAVNIILELVEYSDEQYDLIDYDEDGNSNIVDLVQMVHAILNYTVECEEVDICEGLTEVELWGDCNEFEYLWTDGCMESGSYSIDETSHISFGNTSLMASIPPEIGCLTNLEYLLLDDMELTGEIPVEIGLLTNLTHLTLINNELSGSIPSEIGNLVNLENLDLSNNELSGAIPSEIGDLVKLYTFNLSFNFLSSIPESIILIGTQGAYWNMYTNGLEHFRMNNNFLTTLPYNIGAITVWEDMDLSSNQLTSLPEDMWSFISDLNFSNNQITSIPEDLYYPNVFTLNLYNNQLTELPEVLCEFDYVNVQNNQICPPYLECLDEEWGIGQQDTSECEEVDICEGLTEVELWGEWYDISTTTINLYGQGLTGSIPLEIGCLTDLTYLDLSYNQLTGYTGQIPVEIGNLIDLTYLNLASNQMSGQIPIEIANLTNLTYLALYTNALSGEIPSEICNLIDSNNLFIDNIIFGNNLINTCE